jgi:hypothetical protein
MRPMHPPPTSTRVEEGTSFRRVEFFDFNWFPFMRIEPYLALGSCCTVSTHPLDVFFFIIHWKNLLVNITQEQEWIHLKETRDSVGRGPWRNKWWTRNSLSNDLQTNQFQEICMWPRRKMPASLVLSRKCSGKHTPNGIAQVLSTKRRAWIWRKRGRNVEVERFNESVKEGSFNKAIFPI